MTYQRVTGTLSQGAHPGSYNGQDAYGDMLVTEKHNGLVYRERTSASTLSEQTGKGIELYARPTSNFEGGGET